MKKPSEERRIRDIFTGHSEFQVFSTSTAARISLENVANSDLLIVCNDVLSQNRGFHSLRSDGAVAPPRIYAALYSRQLADIGSPIGPVSGCVLLDGNLQLLPPLVRMANDGYCVMPGAVNDAFIDFRVEQAVVSDLSMIECALAQELGRGRSETEMARIMSLNQSTVRRLLDGLFRTIRATDHEAARAFARRHRERLYQRRRSLLGQAGFAGKTWGEG